MTQPDSRVPGIDAISRSAAAQRPAGIGHAAQPTGPAFQVLLERLQAQAKELETSSKTLEDPAGLASALDVARASLDDATSLSEQLLEAFRERQQQTDLGRGSR